MEDVLEVYQRPYAQEYPQVCFDETSKQQVKETRLPLPVEAGKPALYDYEYERNGVSNLFMMFAPLEGWRHVKVTIVPVSIGRTVSKSLSRFTFRPQKKLCWCWIT